MSISTLDQNCIQAYNKSASQRNSENHVGAGALVSMLQLMLSFVAFFSPV
jgi:hypothetical protein